MSAKFNTRNPAVKRILQEIKELQQAESAELIAEALEDDIFEWHFVVRGTPDSEFEGGIYHGRILLPAEYPFKPPAFMMLTPSGRFQTGVKICLSISSHHPEHWQPSWSVRTALTALVAFMPSPGQGALGSLDFSKDERIQLAAKSHHEVPRFGSPARQAVIDRMHQRMLELERQAGISPSLPEPGAADQHEQVQPGQQQQEQQPQVAAQQRQPSLSAAAVEPAAQAPSPEPSATAAEAEALPMLPLTLAQVPSRMPPPAAGRADADADADAAQRAVQVPTTAGDFGLTALAGVLVVAIAAILLRKILNGTGMLAALS